MVFLCIFGIGKEKIIMNRTFMKERRIFPLVLSMALPMMLSVTYSGTLEALGEGIPSLVISLMRYIVVIIPAAFILSRAMIYK